MKMVKKILLGLTAVAVVIGLAGCKPMVDDEEGAIQGSNNDYSIDYTNEKTDPYRAYHATTLKHAGALVKITFDDPKNDNWSKMGVIFDLHEDENDAREFYIIGLAGSKSDNCYVSKFSNVTDIQAKNFGTDLEENKAVEKVIWNTSVEGGIGSITRPAPDDDGKVSYYVYYKEFKNAGDAATKGYFEWAVFGFSEEEAESAKAIVKKADGNLAQLEAVKASLQSGKIEDAFDLTSSGGLPQNKVAVYAKVDASKTLKGSWKYLDTYKEAEEIEE